MRGVKGLIRNRRGAVLAEFAIALVPMLYAFFCFTQFSKMAIATEVMQHATTVAGRYAMVAYPSCIPAVGAGPDANLAGAATAALGPFTSNITVQGVTASYSSSDPYGDVVTTATYSYRCDVPLGNTICGGGMTKTFSVILPHSGAKYNHACQ